MKNVCRYRYAALLAMTVSLLSGCAGGGAHGPMTVNGTTFSDEHWNGR